MKMFEFHARPAGAAKLSLSVLIMTGGLSTSLLTTTNSAIAAALEGKVQDLDGQPVAGAIVTVKMDSLNATSLTTYSGGDGRFVFSDIGQGRPNGKSLTIQKIGYLPQGLPRVEKKGKAYIASVSVKHIDNVASQVPGSAWMAGFPDKPEAHSIVLNCAQCHHFPFPKAMDYISKFSDLPDDQREKVWYDVMRFMRVKAIAIAPGDAGDVSKYPLKVFSHDGNNGFSKRDEDMMVPMLTKYMPKKFDTYSYADYQKLLAPIGGPATQIREYQLPAPDIAMWHDSAVVRKKDGTLYMYAADWVNPRMARLNPATGELRVLPLPKGLAGAHTLVPDHDGKIWVTFQVSSHLGRFDPETETWKLWNAGKSGWTEGSSGGGLIHSIAYKAGFEVGFDTRGGVWSSLGGTNQLIRIDPKTGKSDVVDAPPTGESPEVGERTLVSGVYGGVMTADGKHVWFTQLEGSLFSVNTETLKVDTIVPIPRGDGPRRLTIDKNDILYVPLNGAGSLFVYDAKANKKIGEYPLPDRAAAPYSANWDAFSNAVWMGGGSASRMYRFDVASKSYTEYPLPTPDNIIIRTIPIDQKTGDVYFSYSPVALLKKPHMLVWLKPDRAEGARKTATIATNASGG
jgi:streptogramin lyase